MTDLPKTPKDDDGFDLQGPSFKVSASGWGMVTVIALILALIALRHFHWW